MSFVEPTNPSSSEIVNNQIQLTEIATYKERVPDVQQQIVDLNKIQSQENSTK